ncbi:MAG: translation initiation inhibitor [Opitutales bacterium]|nr:translation initiation inhibitor [Opitutales bacterium]
MKPLDYDAARRKNSENCQFSIYENDKGASEVFITIEAPRRLSFADSLENLTVELERVYEECGLTERSLVFSRFYLRNIDEQQDELLQSNLYRRLRGGVVSIVQQPPLGEGDLGLFLYHIKGNDFKKEVLEWGDDHWKSGIKISGANYQLLYASNLTAKGENSYEQTDALFASYRGLLAEHGMTFVENVVRTWIYIKDIYQHYAGVVDARNRIFDELGLNRDTHYIASTGIEGRLKEASVFVQMDTLAIGGIKGEQIVYMEAPDYLSSTDDYGVAFERGAKLMFGDRNRFYISGTASIDKRGNIVHPEDVLLQTRRALENIRALLRPHQADLSHMAHLIVYLKDFDQANAVNQIIREAVGGDIPINTVQGSICRPGWLVEIEGVAIVDAMNAYPDYL